jgi:hypothetical protein
MFLTLSGQSELLGRLSDPPNISELGVFFHPRLRLCQLSIRPSSDGVAQNPDTPILPFLPTKPRTPTARTSTKSPPSFTVNPWFPLLPQSKQPKRV